MKLLNKMMEVLYPVTCVFCGAIESSGICSECSDKLVYIGEPRCKCCGKPVRYEEKEYCMDCKRTVFAFEQGRSLWLHQHPVKGSVYQFKYQNRRIYARVYARELAKSYKKLVEKWEVNVIIPVPLHRKRRRIRGYNQAEVLAKYLGQELEIPVETNAIYRVKYTAPQKNLDDKERRKNLSKAFQVSDVWKVKQKVLLVDDIYTTGNTIHAITTKLKGSGVEKVYFLTISIGQGF